MATPSIADEAAKGNGTTAEQPPRSGMTIEHAYGRDEVSGTTEAMLLGAELRLDEYTLIHRGRFGRRSLKTSRFERRGNTFVYVGDGAARA